MVSSLSFAFGCFRSLALEKQRSGMRDVFKPVSSYVLAILLTIAAYEANELELPAECGGDIDLEELWDTAYSFGKQGLFDEARLCFERYAVREPSRDKSWCLLSELHARIGNPSGAVRHATVATRISGYNQSGAEAFFLLANGYMSMNRYDLARQLYYR